MNKVPLFPPFNFGVVDENIYRSGAPSHLNFSFLKTLKLKTIIYLSTGEELDPKLCTFVDENDVKLNVIKCSSPIAEESVVEGLKILMNPDKLPVLVVCHTGKNISGAVIGCYRKLKHWSLISIFEEYRRFIGYNASYIQQQHEQFIDLFDTDLLKNIS